jgi:hypothetical protein
MVISWIWHCTVELQHSVTPLYSAVCRGNIIVIKLLLKNGALGSLTAGDKVICHYACVIIT